MAYINARLHPFPFHDTIHFQIATEKKHGLITYGYALAVYTEPEND